MNGLTIAGLVWLTGGVVAGASLRASGARGGRLAGFAVALAPAVGCGIASLLYFFALLDGFEPRGLGAFVAAAVMVVVVVALWRLRRAAAPSTAAIGTSGSLRPVAVPVGVLAWIAFGVSTLFGVRMLAHLVEAWPEGTWDAVAIWNVRARFLFHAPSDFADLLASVAPSSHPHYPLFLPGSIAAQWAMGGAEMEWTSRLVAVGFTVGLVALTFTVASETRTKSAGALAAALVGGTPLVWVWGASQVADIVVAYLFLAAIAVLASQLDGYPRPPLPPFLGGFLLGLLAWTKNEGWLMAAIVAFLFAAALALGERHRGRRRLRSIGLQAAGGAIPGVAALVLFKRFWAPSGTGIHTFLQGPWEDRLADPQRWWMPVEAMLARLVAVGGWSYLWLALFVGGVATWALHRGRPPTWLIFWIGAVVAVAASWVPIYAITPYDPKWHIGTSIDRLLLQVMPTAATGVVMGAVLARWPRRPAAVPQARPELSNARHSPL